MCSVLITETPTMDSFVGLLVIFALMLLSYLVYDIYRRVFPVRHAASQIESYMRRTNRELSRNELLHGTKLDRPELFDRALAYMVQMEIVKVNKDGALQLTPTEC